MRRIRIGGVDLPIDGPELKAQLARAHATQERPLCLCLSPGVPMYVAHIGAEYALKRMPESGPRHDPSCDSYESPYELSGFGQVAGTAIRENVEDGVTLLKLDFSLSKSGARTAAVATEARESGSVATDGSKLSLRALLHYLWDQAEFNRWRPGMTGKRNWAVIRKFLIAAAEGKTAKGRPLLDVLYVPEMFHSEREAEIAQRRIAFMNSISVEGSRRPLMVLIGEVKELAPARFGHRILVKHVPKFPFLLNEDIHRRMAARYADELSLWEANLGSHLVAIATFGLTTAGVASIDSIALMIVNENWIPFEHNYEAALLDALTRRRASFLKGLRYNLSANQPFASALLREEGASPVAMYIVPPNADEAFHAALDELTTGSEIQSWVWTAGDAEMPALPL